MHGKFLIVPYEGGISVYDVRGTSLFDTFWKSYFLVIGGPFRWSARDGMFINANEPNLSGTIAPVEFNFTYFLVLKGHTFGYISASDLGKCERHATEA